MSAWEPGISFREMLAYSDYLAQRWLEYFKQHEAALDVNVGGRTGTLRNLVGHIFQVEHFFANLLQDSSASPTGPPSLLESPSLDALAQMHRESMEKLGQYISSADGEMLQANRTLGPVTVSSRKVLAQSLIHSIHHWAQVAMEVRQADFPAQPPQDIIISPTMQ
jgi:uncharacterized damage-inducible protein DinB